MKGEILQRHLLNLLYRQKSISNKWSVLNFLMTEEIKGNALRLSVLDLANLLESQGFIQIKRISGGRVLGIITVQGIVHLRSCVVEAGTTETANIIHITGNHNVVNTGNNSMIAKSETKE